MPNAHVFVVDRNTFPVHRDRGFCGVKNPEDIKTRYGLYGDLMGLRKGDLVFFYQMRINEDKLSRGFRGVYKVASEPFFDDSNIEGVPESLGYLGSSNKEVLGKCKKCGYSFSEKVGWKDAITKTGNSKQVRIRVCKKCGKESAPILPNRVLIQTVEHYPYPIDDNTAYIDRDDMKDPHRDVLWTMLFRKTFGAGRERSITPILPEEAEKLERLLKKKQKPTKAPPSKLYPNKDKIKPIKLSIEAHDDKSVKFESMLRAWFMQNIDKDIPVLRDIIGAKEEIEYFGNNVLYGIGGENVDVLVLHKRNDERFKATVIELKKDKVTKKDFEQIYDYTKWISQLVFSNSSDASKIQPVLIGREIPNTIINLINAKKVETSKPILMEYWVENNTIKFKRIF